MLTQRGRRARLTRLIQIGLLLLASAGFAKKPNCRAQAISMLTEKTEVYLVQKHPLMFKFLDCSAKNFGISTVIHEAVHLEDVGAPQFKTEAALKKWFQNPSNINFSLFLINGTKMGELQGSRLPSPKTLIKTFLNKYYPNIASDDSTALQSLIEGYIDDENMLSAQSFSKGLTELNAYVHGLRAEYRTSGEHFQRYGILGTLFFLKAYLYELKTMYPNAYQDILNENNRMYLQKLLSEVSQVLTFTEHCQSMDEIEKRDLFSILTDELFFDGLNEFVNTESSDIRSILCR